ncbi:MAG: single-stranded-DNA-specific exonuclease RecJ [Armatimonadetes bacterium]|nr:single-stranded-DNA-specific exonuclease RecJ [Armatimonadota bacterium]
MADRLGIARTRVEWRIRPRDAQRERHLAAAVGVSPVTAALLANRGLGTVEQARAYFSPSAEQLHDPYSLPDMEAAVRLLNQAVAERQTVLVHGDYDVDGIAATALLARFLSKLGVTVQHFIPHRIHDRYGLSVRAVEEAAAEGARLVLAVDCGIRDRRAVARARELGLTTIVLDHHEPGEELPPAEAIVDPKLAGSAYPNRELTSSGLALQLARAVAAARDIPDGYVLRAFLDLAALGTVADVAELIGENRALVTLGLRHLAQTKKLGLRTLLNLCQVNGRPRAMDIGFRLGPRLNAPGRLADPNPALQLLLTDDQDEANRQALYLDSLNRQRQGEQSAICDQVRAMVERDIDLDRTPVIVLASESWHVGVVGIAASQVVATYGRPAVLLAAEGESYRGSGRSIPEFHLAASLDRCADLLERHGGHAMAVGAQLARGNLEAFRERLCQVAAEQLDPARLCPSLGIDAVTELGEVTPELVEELERMEPFGHGNPEPRLAVKGARVVDRTLVGRDARHLKLWVTDGAQTHECIGFGLAQEEEALRGTQRVDLCFAPQMNEFNGYRTLQLRLHALRAASE